MPVSKRTLTRFKELMEPYVSEEMILWLGQKGFFIAPSSTKHHGACEGGLANHSIAVTETLVELTERNRLEWLRGDSPYLVGMFHDLCKIDQYEISDADLWGYSDNTEFKGHGDKSIMLLCQFMRLTEEEVMCIRYHMGAFTDKAEWSFYSRAVNRFPNVLWTHTADMIASQVKQI